MLIWTGVKPSFMLKNYDGELTMRLPLDAGLLFEVELESVLA